MGINRANRILENNPKHKYDYAADLADFLINKAIKDLIKNEQKGSKYIENFVDLLSDFVEESDIGSKETLLAEVLSNLEERKA